MKSSRKDLGDEGYVYGGEEEKTKLKKGNRDIPVVKGNIHIKGEIGNSDCPIYKMDA